MQTPSTEEGQTEKSTLNTRVLFLALRFADVTNDPLTLESFSVSHSTTVSGGFESPHNVTFEKEGQYSKVPSYETAVM